MECLVLAQNFETAWAYYLQSSGQLFAEQCRMSALQFLEALDELATSFPEVKDPVALSIGENTSVDEIVTRLRRWGKGSEVYPYSSPFESRFMLFVFLTGLKGLLFQRLELTRKPTMVYTSQESEFTEGYVKWSGHLPRSALGGNPDSLVEAACDSSTIVVVGDIRHSQDLMTYSMNAEDFSRRMVFFITGTRKALGKYSGFFDKFTGDGFLAYFNEAICRQSGLNYIECFLEFLREQMEFSISLFRDWVKGIRKLPEKPVGLAIGADFGSVSFQNLSHHLVAVGDAIVWASRMASSASANEIVVNNPLYVALQDRDDIDFEQREAMTKSGEGFLARVMSLKGLVS